MTSDDSYTPGQSSKQGIHASAWASGSGGGVAKRSKRRARSSDDAIAERLVAELAQPANGGQAQMKAGGQSDSLTDTTGTGTATPRSAGTVATVSGRSASVGRGSPDFSDDNKDRKRRPGATAGGAGASQQELHSMPPARVKRILANRQSAARSKERKLAYISELEAQVSALTVQLTSASLQLRSLQQDTSSLGECNKALSQQAMVLREHVSQRDAETSMLLAELRRAQGLLAAHNIPMGDGPMLPPLPSPRVGGTPFQHPPSNVPKLAMGVGSFAGMVGGGGYGGSPQGVNSLLMAEAAAAAAASAARSGPGISPELQHRAQMQAMERHQAQQRLWSNSVSSATDVFSPQASPRLDPATLQQHLAACGAPASRPLAVPSLGGGGGSAGSTMAHSSNLSGKTAADLLADLRKRSTSGRSSDGGLDGFANNYGGSSGNIAAAANAGGAAGAETGLFPPASLS